MFLCVMAGWCGTRGRCCNFFSSLLNGVTKSGFFHLVSKKYPEIIMGVRHLIAIDVNSALDEKGVGGEYIYIIYIYICIYIYIYVYIYIHI